MKYPKGPEAWLKVTRLKRRSSTLVRAEAALSAVAACRAKADNVKAKMALQKNLLTLPRAKL
jgi:hypothetical protein